MTRKNLTL